MQHSCDFSAQSCHINHCNRLQHSLAYHFFSPFFLSLMYLYMYFVFPHYPYLFPCLFLINYVPYTQDIRNIYVGYTYDNRVNQQGTPNISPPLHHTLYVRKTPLFPLKTLKTPKTFSSKNLHIRKFSCIFATDSVKCN